MARLHLDAQLYALGESVQVPYPLARAAAWWVAAELIRRHPKRLTVVETHPGGGQYDCVSVYRTDTAPSTGLVVFLNVAGHLTHEHWFGSTDSSGEDDRFNWFEVIATPNRRRYVVEQLERVEGLTSPTSTPRTVRGSIGPLLLSHLATTMSIRRDGWDIRNAFHDSAGDWSGVLEWSRSVPGIAFEAMPDDFANEPAYRYWGVLDPDGQAAAIVDVRRGLAWRHDGDGIAIDLLGLYSAQQRRLDRVAQVVLPEIN